MFHAPFAANRQGNGISFEGEVLLVEDPVIVGVFGKGALDAGNGSRDIGFGYWRDLDRHFWGPGIPICAIY